MPKRKKVFGDGWCVKPNPWHWLAVNSNQDTRPNDRRHTPVTVPRTWEATVKNVTKKMPGEFTHHTSNTLWLSRHHEPHR